MLEPAAVTDLLCGEGNRNEREDRICVRFLWWRYNPCMSWSWGSTVYYYYRASLAELYTITLSDQIRLVAATAAAAPHVDVSTWLWWLSSCSIANCVLSQVSLVGIPHNTVTRNKYMSAAAAVAAAAVHATSVSTRFLLLLLPLLMVIIMILLLDTNGVWSTVILVRIRHNIVLWSND